MIELSEDADLSERFSADPEAVLAASNLTEVDKDAVRTRDNARVREQVNVELEGIYPPLTVTFLHHTTDGWIDD